jgi:hypothetical protein
LPIACERMMDLAHEEAYNAFVAKWYALIDDRPRAFEDDARSPRCMSFRYI